ncbi:MAG: hypothetical protein OXC62_04535 [Aestuariivita sp.]|nr:hypothetical protein [Aestuariivita sp.]
MVAETLVFLIQVWLGVGALVAGAFLLIGIGQVDEDAHGAFAFRPLLIPGILVIWPLVIWRWWVVSTGRDINRHIKAAPRRSHGIVTILLMIILVGTLLISFAIHQERSINIAPVKLDMS